ncbi:MAG TPA: penicillin-binding transpeptidase domain-containing protein [Micrococcaceae bacterium]|nr:penicillin-binding transpeptidase domain-containing protein [Micrococcaceae bacterium]
MAAGLILLVTATALSGCDDGKAGAQEAARQLAAGLSGLDLGSVSLTGKDGAAATAALTTLTKGLQPIKPTVSVASVDVKQDTATVALKVDWKFDGGTWDYTTHAALAKKDGSWKAGWTPDLLVPAAKDGDALAMTTTAAARADILGDGGAVLVTERPVIHLGIDKSHVDAAEQPASAKALAELAGVEPDAFVRQVAAAGPAAFVEALVIRNDADRTITDAQIAAIPGASGLPGSLPLAPTRSFARAVLGTVGDATAELIGKSNGKLKAGDQTGLSGLSQQYDDQLRGAPGIQISLDHPADADAPKNADGTAAAIPRNIIFHTEPKAGTPLATTLSPALQTLGETVLAGETTPAAIVAIRPSTGAVLAAASSPGSNGYNTALLGQFPPGSTFKVATSLALLRKGQTPETTEECTPTVTVDGKSFKNANSYPSAHLGRIPLREAFAHSCNTAFISNQGVASQPDLADAAAALGLGVDPHLGAPAFFGSVPSSASTTDHAASMIGQGKVLVSPLAIATVAASVAHGALVQPKLVLPAGASASGAAGPQTASAATGASGAAGPQTASANTGASGSAAAGSAGPQAAKPLTKEEAAQLSDMMRGVVTSGHAGFLADVPGAPVIAKTGTAEYGTELPLKTHAWIIAAQGDLAVAVFVEDGDYGAVSGGPLLKAFLTGAAG